MSVPKVLVVGAVQGQLEKAFQKITKLHLKQNFSFVIVVGDLFASDPSEESESQVKSLLNGTIKVPLPTYFTVGDHSLPPVVQDRLEATGEVCTNLFYLGRKGTLKTTEGVRIINLGGNLVQNEASLTQAIGKYDPLYTESESRSLHGAHSADILITNRWPADITKNSQVIIPDSLDPTTGTQSIANLCLALKPRYHFASSPMAAWSREPFMIPPSVEGRQLKSYEELDGPVRFSSLASIDKSNKECLSAFNLDPKTPPSKEGAQQSCPLTVSSAVKRKREGEGDTNYRYSRDGQHDARHRRNNNNKRQRPMDSSTCFMCASNPSFDDTMVVSIAEDSMLTVLKGPLPIRGTTFTELKSSGHIMIIPMYHAADEAAHGKRDLQDMQREFDEMTRYRHSLQQMLGSKGLGAVCWEVNRTGIRHFHWQLIACPADKIASGMVEAAYKVAAEAYKIRSSTTQDENGQDKLIPVKFMPCDPDKLIPGQRSDFFRVWIWNPELPTSSSSSPPPPPPEKSKPMKSPITTADAIANGHDDDSTTQPSTSPQQQLPTTKGTETSLFFAIPASMSFNISFGREVIAGILQLEHRTDWRVLETGDGIEKADAKAWQDEFQHPNGSDQPGWDFAMS